MPVFFANTPDSSTNILDSLNELQNLDTTDLFNSSIVGVKGKYIFILDKNSVVNSDGATIIPATPTGRWFSSNIPCIMIDNNNQIDTSQIPEIQPDQDLTVNNLTVLNDAIIDNDLTVSNKITSNLDIEANQTILAGVRVGEEFQGVLSSFQGNITCTGGTAGIIFNSLGNTSYIQSGNDQLITDRQTGFTTPTGTPNKNGSTLNTATSIADDATIRLLIAHVLSIENALITHGLIGS